MQNPCVLITRPEGSSTGAVEAVTQRGYEAISNPLLEYVSVAAALPPTGFDAILFTSTAAIRFCPPIRNGQTLVFTVGEHTAQTAKAHGYENALCIGQTVGQAASWLAASALTPDRTLLYVSGVHVSDDLEALLAGRGPKIVRVPVYDTRCLPLEKTTIELLYARRIAWILLFSGRTAEALRMAMAGLHDHRWSEAISLACLGARVPEPLAAFSWRSIRIAAEPKFDALIALLPEAGR